MKKLNLLPPHIRFDYEKIYIIKLISYALILNITLLVVIFTNEYLIINSLNKQLNEKNNYLNQIKTINNSFAKYQQEYKKLTNYLKEIKDKEKTFFSYYKKDYSPIVSLLIHLNSIRHGIFIKSVNYSKGFFVIQGQTNKNKYFYNYYKTLEDNPYIAELDFSNLTADKELNNFTFNISFKVRKLNEIF